MSKDYFGATIQFGDLVAKCDYKGSYYTLYLVIKFTKQKTWLLPLYNVDEYKSKEDDIRCLRIDSQNNLIKMDAKNLSPHYVNEYNKAQNALYKVYKKIN